MSHFGVVVMLLVLLVIHQICLAYAISVHLHPNHESEGSVNLSKLKDVTTNADSWTITASNQCGMHMKIALGVEFAFHPTETTTLSMDIGSKSDIDNDELMITFGQTASNSYFGLYLALDGKNDHKIYPGSQQNPGGYCDSTNPYEQSYADGDAQELALTVSCGGPKFNERMLAIMGGKQAFVTAANIQFPLTLILENHPGTGGYLLFTYMDRGTSPVSCGYVQMLADTTMDIYLAADDNDNSVEITYINITREYQSPIDPSTNLSDNPSGNPTNNPTKIPTIHPTKNPSTNPTMYTINNPTNNPTNNPSTTTNPATNNPTTNPSMYPIKAPTMNPTQSPTNNPTNGPAPNPSQSTSLSSNPTDDPFAAVSVAPSANPISTDAPLSTSRSVYDGITSTSVTNIVTSNSETKHQIITTIEPFQYKEESQAVVIVRTLVICLGALIAMGCVCIGCQHLCQKYGKAYKIDVGNIQKDNMNHRKREMAPDDNIEPNLQIAEVHNEQMDDNYDMVGIEKGEGAMVAMVDGYGKESLMIQDDASDDHDDMAVTEEGNNIEQDGETNVAADEFIIQGDEDSHEGANEKGTSTGNTSTA
eukprot:1057265_1